MTHSIYYRLTEIQGKQVNSTHVSRQYYPMMNLKYSITYKKNKMIHLCVDKS